MNSPSSPCMCSFINSVSPENPTQCNGLSVATKNWLENLEGGRLVRHAIIYLMDVDQLRWQEEQHAGGERQDYRKAAPGLR